MEETLVSEIVVDTNPHELPLFNNLIAAEPGAVRRERLDVGDVLLRANGATLIIERKTFSDLAASLADGRSQEQRARQLAAVGQDSTGKTQLLYMIEGPLSSHDLMTTAGFNVKAAECALVKASVRDGIPVIRVPDHRTLCDTVHYLYKSLGAGELDGEATAQKRAAAGYADTVHVKKAANDDPELSWKMVLATFRGISMDKAAQLARTFPGPLSLSRAIEGRPAKEAMKIIAAADVGKDRKLGPAIAKRVFEVFSK
jgi:ERCC4-type nuclease